MVPGHRETEQGEDEKQESNMNPVLGSRDPKRAPAKKNIMSIIKDLGRL